jgi:hypothetical protein
MLIFPELLVETIRVVRLWDMEQEFNRLFKLRLELSYIFMLVVLDLHLLPPVVGTVEAMAVLLLV